VIFKSSLISALGVSLLLAVVAAACGDGGGDSGPAPEPAPTATAMPPPVAVQTPRADDTPGPDATAAVSTPVAEATPVVVNGDVNLSATSRTGDERPAPELTDITGWINSEPFTLESRQGEVVLIDFWTYTCVNCIRTLPYLRSWHKKYADKGLVILGVHSPEFEFEKLRENVVKAMGNLGVEYAVAQDNEFGTWRAFRNRYWPSKYLIDRDGYIRYSHFGEGSYQETEQKIRELLVEIGADLSDVSPDTEPEAVVDPASLTNNPKVARTRELYAGYERNNSALQSQTTPPYILHSEYYEDQDVDILYKDPRTHENHFIYLQGMWTNNAERLVHARETENYEDYIAIRFYATSVNAVMAPLNPGTLTVRLTLDGEPVMPKIAGGDVMYDEDGNSYFTVDEARMFFLVDKERFSGHELVLSANSADFSLFAFTFGSYEGGEPGS
jgi:thiol-disulfide isomerase/thioredoxin